MIKLSWTPKERDELRRTFESSTGEWFEVALKVADLAVSLFLARASGQVKEDREAVMLAIRAADTLWAPDVSTAKESAALDRLQALAQEAESLRAKVAELEKDIANERSHTHRLTFLLGDVLTALGMQRMNPTQISMLAMGADSEQMVISRARAVVSERNTARAEMERLRVERDAARDVIASRDQTWHDLERRAMLAESRLAAVRETLKDMAAEDDTDAPVPADFKAGWHAARKYLIEALEGDAPNSPGFLDGSPNPSMPSNANLESDLTRLLREVLSGSVSGDLYKTTAGRGAADAIAEFIATTTKERMTLTGERDIALQEIKKYRKRAAKWKRRAQEAALDFYEGFLIGHKIGQATHHSPADQEITKDLAPMTKKNANAPAPLPTPQQLRREGKKLREYRSEGAMALTSIWVWRNRIFEYDPDMREGLQVVELYAFQE